MCIIVALPTVGGGSERGSAKCNSQCACARVQCIHVGCELHALTGDACK